MSGEISAERFRELQLDKTFKPRTLEEMRALEPEIFEKVFDEKGNNNLTSSGKSSILDNEGMGVAQTNKSKGASGLSDIDFGFSKNEGEHSIQDDLKAVNPNRDKDEEHQTNCVNCAATYELRRRGYDVEALPSNGRSDFNNMFDGFTPIELSSIDKDETSARVEMLTQIQSWGDGARGTIRGDWDGEDFGHRFSIEVADKDVMFLDSQNISANATEYMRCMQWDTIAFGRLDNLQPNELIKTACKNRTEVKNEN